MVLGVFTTLLALVALQLREQRIALHLFYPGLAVKCSTLKQVLKYLCTLFLALDCPCTFMMDMQMPHRILIFNLCISKWCLTLFIKWLTSLKTPLNSQKNFYENLGNYNLKPGHRKGVSTCARTHSVMFLYYALQQAPHKLHPACVSLENSVTKCPRIAPQTVLLSLLVMAKLMKRL